MAFLRRLFSPQPAPLPVVPRKTYTGGWGVDWLPNYVEDLRGDSASLAVAVAASVHAFRCIQVRARTISGLHWRVVNTRTGKEVFNKQDATISHPFVRALRAARRRHKTSLLNLWQRALCVHGEAYFEIIRDQQDLPTGLKWLNPAAITLDVARGQVVGYRYSGANGTVMLSPHDVIYDKYPNDADDLTGLSPLEVALSNVNIDRNTKRFVSYFFRNNARPQIIFSPANNMTWNDEQVYGLIETLRNQLQGVRNAGRPLVSPNSMNVEALEMPDLSQHEPMMRQVALEIYIAYGVPRSMAGDTDSTRYQSSSEELEWFYLNTIMPEGANIEEVINIDVLPLFDETGELHFAFDYDQSGVIGNQKLRAAELTKQRLDMGIITINDARIAQGLEPVEQLNGLYLIGGTPVPQEEIATIWKARYPVPDLTPYPEIPTGPQLSITPEEQEKPIATRYWPAGNEEPYHDNALRELKAWQKVWQKDPQRAKRFNPEYLRGDVADIIAGALSTDASDAIAHIFEQTRELLAIRAIQATRLNFEMAFEDVLFEARAGTLRKARFVSILRNLIARFGASAYSDGLIDGGILDATVDEEDLSRIQRLSASQNEYVRGLADVLFKRDDALTDLQALNKPEMWFNKSIYPFYMAGLQQAANNALMEWVIGPTEEHCPDCTRLNGQRHRLRHWLKRDLRPRADTLACQGFHCACQLVRVIGRARGNF